MGALGWYRGQARAARELAVRKLGADEAALMDDDAVVEWIIENYAIFWGDCEVCGAHGWDNQTIALVPNDVFHGIVDEIEWLRR